MGQLAQQPAKSAVAKASAVVVAATLEVREVSSTDDRPRND